YSTFKQLDLEIYEADSSGIGCEDGFQNVSAWCRSQRYHIAQNSSMPSWCRDLTCTFGGTRVTEEGANNLPQQFTEVIDNIVKPTITHQPESSERSVHGIESLLAKEFFSVTFLVVED
ncbi:hypothetical protein TNCV_2308431, partial [Trichonephila clavipes]